MVPEGHAGLSAFGSVFFIMVSGVLKHVSSGSLRRHKVDITLKERYRAGRRCRAVNDVGCPAWTITAITYTFSPTYDGLDVTMKSMMAFT